MPVPVCTPGFVEVVPFEPGQRQEVRGSLLAGLGPVPGLRL